ncbi:hypothetical protein ASE14_07565 [Agromyces sp. Root81]|uniref:hypothetical protein n=1 Tax=Agromyces sp. Root81 TaxID=1736601 RepID=UPI0006F3FEF3|nr:hypothetical protein [Agromyces sp. Root81]KRC60820.1 hypothetical protein ASE14_07565 [Agromyces sp. Root81]
MTIVQIPYDTERWIRVPVEWSREPWDGPAEWAEWLADETTRARDGAEPYVEAIRDHALAIAGYSSEDVSARFWYFPIDGDPAGWVDVFMQQHGHDGAVAAEMLPELERAVIEPAVDALEVTDFDSAVRRLSLLPFTGSDSGGADGTATPGIMAKGEWLAVSGEWLVYLVTIDADPRALSQRLGDTDRLIGGLDPAVLSGQREADA